MKFFKIFLQIILMCLCFLAGMQYERTILYQEENDISKSNTQVEDNIIKGETIDVVPDVKENINDENNTNSYNENIYDSNLESPAINNNEIINKDSNVNIENGIKATEESVIIINDINENSNNLNSQEILVEEEELTPQIINNNSKN